MSREESTTRLPGYVAGSDTSLAAAVLKRSTAIPDEARVLALIKLRGSYGATDQEVEHELGMIHETASARRHGLRRRGLVRDSGQRRKTPRGRAAVVWIAGTDAALLGVENDRVARPSGAAIKKALRNIVDIVACASEIGGPSPGAELEAVRKWLAWIGRNEA